VDDVFLMHRLHRPRQRLHQRRGLAGGQRPAFQLVGDAATFRQLHREERLPLALADLEDLYDVRVLQPGDGPRLRLEAGQPRLAGVAAVRAHHLEGDDAVEADLPGLVDDAHAALTQFLNNLVTGHLGEMLRGGPGRDLQLGHRLPLPLPWIALLLAEGRVDQLGLVRELTQVVLGRGLLAGQAAVFDIQTEQLAQQGQASRLGEVVDVVPDARPRTRGRRLPGGLKPPADLMHPPLHGQWQCSAV
jgi:hypothetical protein